LSFNLCPGINEIVAAQNRLKPRVVERSLLDELQDACFVFRASASSTSGPVGGRNCTGQSAIITYSPFIDQPRAAR
jgi:hypothetical protein